MSEELQFELVSPERLLYSKPVTLVTLPGEMGAFGVLIGHIPMIASIKAGVVDVYEKDRAQISERIFVAGGFAEVTGKRCTLLAEEAYPVSELNKENLEQELKDLNDDLLVTLNVEKIDVLTAKRDLVAAKLQALR